MFGVYATHADENFQHGTRILLRQVMFLSFYCSLTSQPQEVFLIRAATPRGIRRLIIDYDNGYAAMSPIQEAFWGSGRISRWHIFAGAEAAGISRDTHTAALFMLCFFD